MEQEANKQYYVLDIIRNLNEYVDPNTDKFWDLKSKLTTILGLISSKHEDLIYAFPESDSVDFVGYSPWKVGMNVRYRDKDKNEVDGHGNMIFGTIVDVSFRPVIEWENADEPEVISVRVAWHKWYNDHVITTVFHPDDFLCIISKASIKP